MQTIFIRKKRTFDLITNKNKTIEGRINAGFNSQLKIGKLYYLQNDNHKIIIQIEKIEYFSSIENMINNIKLDKILPDIKSIKDAIKYYYNIYPITRFGNKSFIAFYIKVV